MFSGINGGSGVGQFVNNDTELLYKSENERSLEKVQLFQRAFLTVPYLGRGSCDPSLESQLLQGEIVNDKKSVSTIMEKSFMNHSLYPLDDKMNEHLTTTTEDVALNGWIRGGALTRDMSNDPNFSKNNRPNDNSY